MTGIVLLIRLLQALDSANRGQCIFIFISHNYDSFELHIISRSLTRFLPDPELEKKFQKYLFHVFSSSHTFFCSSVAIDAYLPDLSPGTATLATIYRLKHYKIRKFVRWELVILPML